uniref:Uncharacterized protein n=1 Tax=Arundo donax TaxID=35708 RepID=A0A0A9AT15_ARUDO
MCAASAAWARRPLAVHFHSGVVDGGVREEEELEEAHGEPDP